MPDATALQLAGFAQADLPHERRIEPLTEVQASMIPSIDPTSPEAHMGTALRQVKTRLRVRLKDLQFRVPVDLYEEYRAKIVSLPSRVQWTDDKPVSFLTALVLPDPSLTDTVVVESR